ncbi:helix-turn-helix domain-containing protein [Myroides sp. JBRI-B21084]|uniref:helix-turn-helix domain-containing protein n=1 Tax=Myroides sp. JBRI-B21084 TaxID=3119977 RepID=UPI0026E3D11B|nr:helix-turn-helix domain-containing protein [Paenimyroides cloacae]WKW46730.1 helix-turn-helix domain-containing protein [Paenimyroides cloacae]
MSGEKFGIVHIPYEEWQAQTSKIEYLTKCVLKLLAKNQKETMTVNEACEFLKCSRNTLNSYVEKGLLKPIQVKQQKYSKVLFKREDLEYLINTVQQSQ